MRSSRPFSVKCLALSSASLLLAASFEARFAIPLYYAIQVFASNWKEAISRRGSSDASALLPVSRYDHHATALEAYAAAVRTAPVDSRHSFFFLPRLLGKTTFSESHSGQWSILPGMKSSLRILKGLAITS